MADKNIERLQIEWLVVSALRENLSMLDDKTNVTYNRAIEFAQKNFPELFGKSDSVFGKKEIVDKLYEKYAEEAKAKSIAESKPITAEQLIESRVNEIENLIKNPLNKETKVSQLKKEKIELNMLLRDSIPMFTAYTDGEALLNDYTQRRPDMDYVKQVRGKYSIYKTKSGDPFVMRFLHPGKAETATGVDLIYEYHDKGKIRIIAVQYKIWEDGVLYFSQSKNLAAQLNTATKCFCNKGYCDATPKKSSSKMDFRLPCCVPFLRPTDKLQNPDSPFTSGWHIPVCQLPSRLDKSHDGNKILRLERVTDVAINAPEFERLFEKGMIGSRWFTKKELLEFNKLNKVLDSTDDNIIILTQRF